MNVFRRAWFYSLVAGLLIGVAWWRSYRSDSTLLAYADTGRVQAISSFEGQTSLLFTNMHAGAQRSWSLDWFSTAPTDESAFVRLFQDQLVTTHHGFAFVNLNEGDLLLDNAKGLLLIVPDWLLMILALTAPACQIRPAIRSHQRRKRGQCLVCGYDLRATPDRCPECGTARPG